MNKIYLVVCSSGEYPDYSEWTIVGYTNKEIAEKHKNLAQEEYDKLTGHYTSKPTKYDPTPCRMWGDKYFIKEVSIYTDMEEFLNTHKNL